MTAADIVTRLCEAKGFAITAQRVMKAKVMANRQHVLWEDVLAAMSSEQRAAVEGAS